MKRRLAIYVLCALPLAIFTWYAARITMLALAMWGITALAITLYEIKQSGKPTMSALAVTVFWQASITFYTLYWAGIVFLGFGGEQLEHLKIGLSPDWLVRDWQFYRHTILPHLADYGLLALMLGPLLGVGVGWLFVQSGLDSAGGVQEVQQ